MMQRTSIPQSSMDVLVLISAVIIRVGVALAWIDNHAATFPGLCSCWIQSRTQSSYPGKDLWEILPTLRVLMTRWRDQFA